MTLAEIELYKVGTRRTDGGLGVQKSTGYECADSAFHLYHPKLNRCSDVAGTRMRDGRKNDKVIRYGEEWTKMINSRYHVAA